MSIFQHLTVNLANGWWFSLVFIIINILMITIYPKHFKLRVLKQPEYDSIFQRICSAISFLLFQFTIWYSIFIPIALNTTSFYIGSVLYITGLIGYITAMMNYATTYPDRPVTKGIYRLSRNPQQVMSILLWFGIGLTLQSYIIMLCAILQLPLSYPGFKAQEKTCVKKYGQPYVEYKEKTKRYFGFTK